MANGLDCDHEVSEFELQSRYYVHFWTNVVAKSMNSFIPPFMGYIVSLQFFY